MPTCVLQSLSSLKIYLNNNEKEELSTLLSKEFLTKDVVRKAQKQATENSSDLKLNLQIALNAINILLKQTGRSITYEDSPGDLTAIQNTPKHIDGKGKTLYYLKRMITKNWAPKRITPLLKKISNSSSTSSQTRVDELQTETEETVAAVTLQDSTETRFEKRNHTAINQSAAEDSRTKSEEEPTSSTEANPPQSLLSLQVYLNNKEKKELSTLLSKKFLTEDVVRQAQKQATENRSDLKLNLQIALNVINILLEETKRTITYEKPPIGLTAVRNTPKRINSEGETLYYLERIITKNWAPERITPLLKKISNSSSTSSQTRVDELQTETVETVTLQDSTETRLEKRNHTAINQSVAEDTRTKSESSPESKRLCNQHSIFRNSRASTLPINIEKEPTSSSKTNPKPLLPERGGCGSAFFPFVKTLKVPQQQDNSTCSKVNPPRV